MIGSGRAGNYGLQTLVSALALAFTLCACTEASPPPPAEEVAVIRVRDFGTIRFRFFADVAPAHVAAFKKLARAGFYDGTTFHRVLPGMFVQGGDPNSKDDDPSNDGLGGPGYFLPAEFSDIPHRTGIVSMARKNDPDTAGSQFFIMVADHEDWKELFDGQFTVFGEVIEGLDVAVRISRVERDRQNHRPLSDVVMESVRIEPLAG